VRFVDGGIELLSFFHESWVFKVCVVSLFFLPLRELFGTQGVLHWGDWGVFIPGTFGLSFRAVTVVVVVSLVLLPPPP